MSWSADWSYASTTNPSVEVDWAEAETYSHSPNWWQSDPYMEDRARYYDTLARRKWFSLRVGLITLSVPPAALALVWMLAHV